VQDLQYKLIITSVERVNKITRHDTSDITIVSTCEENICGRIVNYFCYSFLVYEANCTKLGLRAKTFLSFAQV
jgi:hypothetical protein